MYTHWISPLKEQLADVQKELKSILTITASNSLSRPGPSKSGVAGCIASAQGSVGGPGAQANSVQNAVDDDLGSDDVTKESNNGTGHKYFTIIMVIIIIILHDCMSVYSFEIVNSMYRPRRLPRLSSQGKVPVLGG